MDRNLQLIFEVLDEFRKLDAFMGSQTAQAFVAIAMREPCRMGDVAPLLGLSQSTASVKIQKLTDKDRHKNPGYNLVRAEPDPSNMRRKIIKLTPKGRKFLADIIRRMEQFNAQNPS